MAQNGPWVFAHQKGATSGVLQATIIYIYKFIYLYFVFTTIYLHVTYYLFTAWILEQDLPYPGPSTNLGMENFGLEVIDS